MVQVVNALDIFIIYVPNNLDFFFNDVKMEYAVGRGVWRKIKKANYVLPTHPVGTF